MIRLLASFLVALALFLSPMVMEMGGGMAMAETRLTETDGGCAGHHAPADDRTSDMKMSCAIACAAIPGTPATVKAQVVPAKGATLIGAAHMLTGIWPEGETPPPRSASEI